MPDTASRVFVDGRIHVGGGHFAEAMVVEGDQFVYVGTSEGARRAAPAGSEHVSLRGRTVVPGLIDAHLHVMDSALRRAGVDLLGVTDATKLLDRVVRWAELHPEGPILGWGWDQERMRGGWPDRSGLDRRFPDRAVVLDRVCTHVTLVNGAALARAAVNPDSRDPPGGRIGRTNRGDPNGLLFENAVGVTGAIRAESFGSFAPEARATMRHWSGLGLVAAGAMSVEVEEYQALEAAQRSVPLPLDLHLYARLGTDWSRFPSATRSSGRVLRMCGVKAVLDGSLGARTAWLRAPYSDAPGESGLALWEEDALFEKVEKARRAGLAVALHAIGDRALDLALRTAAGPAAGGPVRFEHVSVVPPERVAAIREAGVTCVVQPPFRASDTWVEDRLGTERAQWVYRFRDFRDAAIPIAGSSDAPVESPDPWAGMRAAAGLVPTYGARANLSTVEALDLYTRGAALAIGRSDLGRIVEGARADFVVLEASSLDAAVRSDRNPVVETWRAGAPEGRAVRPESQTP